jgi:hypothetical protein
MSPRLRAAAAATLIFVACTAVWAGQRGRAGSPRGPSAGGRGVISFRAAGVSGLEALLALGRLEHLPMGIRYVDRGLAEKPITVSVRGATLGEAVRAIMRQESGYTWTLSRWLLSVNHIRAPRGRHNLLSTVIPDFRARRETLQECSYLLYMDLYLVLRPGTTGFAGDYYPGRLSSLVGPLHLRGLRVAAILDRLVCVYGDAAWMVTLPPGYMDELPPRGLWKIVDYRDPRDKNAAQWIRQRVAEYTQASADGRPAD